MTPINRKIPEKFHFGHFTHRNPKSRDIFKILFAKYSFWGGSRPPTIPWNFRVKFWNAQKVEIWPLKQGFYGVLPARETEALWRNSVFIKKFLFTRRSDWTPFMKNFGKLKIIFAKKCVCTPLCQDRFFYFREKTCLHPI